MKSEEQGSLRHSVPGVGAHYPTTKNKSKRGEKCITTNHHHVDAGRKRLQRVPNLKAEVEPPRVSARKPPWVCLSCTVCLTAQERIDADWLTNGQRLRQPAPRVWSRGGRRIHRQCCMGTRRGGPEVLCGTGWHGQREQHAAAEAEKPHLLVTHSEPEVQPTRASLLLMRQSCSEGK